MIDDNFWYSGPAGNNIMKTNVPNVRLQFRVDMLEHERNLLAYAADHEGGLEQKLDAAEEEEAMEDATSDVEESPEPRARPHRVTIG